MKTNNFLKSLEYFWFNLTTQIIIYFFIAIFASWQIIILNYPNIVSISCSNFSKELIKSSKGDFFNQDKLNSLANKYGISWIVLTNNSLKPIHQYLPLPSKLIQLSNHETSNFQICKHEKYLDTCQKIANNNYLHIGYSINDFPDLTNLFQPYLFRVNILYLFAVLVISIFLFCITLLVSMPLMISIKHYSLTAKPNALIQVLQDITLGFCAYELKTLNQFLKNYKQQIEEYSKTATQDNNRNTKFLEIEKSKLERQFQNEILDLKMKVADFEYHHNINEFVKSLADEITASKSLTKSGYKIVSSLRNLFLDNFLFSVLVVNRDQQFKILASTGFDGQSMQQLSRLAFNLVFGSLIKTAKDILAIESSEFSAYGINHVSQWTSFVRAYFFPIYFQNEPIGLYTIFQTASDKELNKANINSLKELLKTISVSFVQILRYQQQYEAARTDVTTQLCNNKYFYEIMPYIIKRASINYDENPFSVLMIEIKHLYSIVQEFGQSASDKILKEVANICLNLVSNRIPLDEEVMSKSTGNHLIRYGNDKLLIILENTNIINSLQLANQIKINCASNENNWPHNILYIHLAIGVVTCPFNGKTAEDLIVGAEKALYFANELPNETSVMHLFHVDESKKDAINTNTMIGDLAILDPSALLQSIEMANKSGVLIAENKNDKKISISFEKGKPILAKLDELKGKDAIIEFITCFHNGKFNFQEQKKLKSGTILKLQNLDPACVVNKALASILMDAALAQDNFNWAQNILSATPLTVQLPISNGQELFNQIISQNSNINKLNNNVLITIIDLLIKNNTPLEIINYTNLPSHEKWVALALIYQALNN